MKQFEIRAARVQDCEVLCDLIMGLAEYEKLADQAKPDPKRLEKELFGEHPVISSAIGWEIEDGHEKPVAFVLYFHNFSTFLTQRGLYLEDLFVRPESRRLGYGLKMIKYLAKEAVRLNCGRFEWSVLDWNQPAIDFYESLGATVMQEWCICRVTGEGLVTLSK